MALIRLPSKLPEHFKKSRMQLGMGTLAFLCTAKILTSMVFGYIGIADNLGPSVIYLALLAIGAVYYAARRAHLHRQGIRIEDLLKKNASIVFELDDESPSTNIARDR